ncbi:MAG: sulfatase [Phycisphaerae bacterium]
MSAAQSSSSPPPNVLLIYTDQQRHDALGAAGNPDILTPNLDRLAGRGVRFARNFVQNPVCMPSRISMLTGRYCSNLGISHMAVPVPSETDTLPVYLRRAGYTTAQIGKLHFLPHSNRDHRDPHPAYGFDHLEVSDEPGPYDDAYRAFIRRTMPDQLDAVSAHVFPPMAKAWREILLFDDGVKHPADWRPWTTTPFCGRDEATHTAFVGQRTIDYLQQHASAGRGSPPFFCIAGFYSPHSPLVAPQTYLDLYDPAAFTLPPLPPEVADEGAFTEANRRQAMHGYYAMVSEVDAWVGSILETLEEQQLADNTLVVFTSDHGEFLGEHLRWGKWHPAPDCVSRVPMLVSGPGIVPGVCEGITESVDLVPTLLERCGVPVPAVVDGQSWGNMLAGEAFAGKPAALVEDHNRLPGWKSLRTATHRYILDAAGEEQLFDLNAEFGEYRDVHADPAYAESLQAMRHQLATRMLAVEKPLSRVWPY